MYIPYIGMYMYIHLHLHVHILEHLYIHACIHTSVHVWTCLCMHACMYVLHSTQNNLHYQHRHCQYCAIAYRRAASRATVAPPDARAARRFLKCAKALVPRDCFDFITNLRQHEQQSLGTYLELHEEKQPRTCKESTLEKLAPKVAAQVQTWDVLEEAQGTSAQHLLYQE